MGPECSIDGDWSDLILDGAVPDNSRFRYLSEMDGDVPAPEDEGCTRETVSQEPDPLVLPEIAHDASMVVPRVESREVHEELARLRQDMVSQPKPGFLANIDET